MMIYVTEKQHQVTTLLSQFGANMNSISRSSLYHSRNLCICDTAENLCCLPGHHFTNYHMASWKKMLYPFLDNKTVRVSFYKKIVKWVEQSNKTPLKISGEQLLQMQKHLEEISTQINHDKKQLGFLLKKKCSKSPGY